MAYNADHGVNLGVLKNSLTRAKTEWLAAISKSGHGQYKKWMPCRSRMQHRKMCCIW